jgi:hypothetical protein
MTRFSRTDWSARAGRQPLGSARPRSPAPSTVESVIDQFAALERTADAHRYPGNPPDPDDLRRRVDLVMDVEERAKQIENDARDRATERRLMIAERLLPIGLKALIAIVTVTVLVIALSTVDRSELDTIVDRVASVPGATSATLVTLGGGFVARTLHIRAKARHAADKSEPPRGRKRAKHPSSD